MLVRHGGADGQQGPKWPLALGQPDRAETSAADEELGWSEGPSGSHLISPALLSGTRRIETHHFPPFGVNELTAPGLSSGCVCGERSIFFSRN